MTVASAKAFSVFYSYANEDIVLRDELDKHLAALRRSGWIQSWYDRDIRAGTEWKQEIDTHLRTADIILLLVSSDFLSSEYCYSIEMREALRRHEAGEAVVIPIILRPVDWHETPFSSLQVLPGDGKPVTSWSNRDEAFKQVAQGIRSVVKALRQWVFIASSPLDQPFAERLCRDLAAHGVVLCNWKQKHSPNVPAQDETTHQAIQIASTVVLIASPDAPNSPILEEHLKLASLSHRRIIAVWASGDDWNLSIPKGWEKVEAIDARKGRYEEALSELLVRLKQQVSVSPPMAALLNAPEISSEPRNPYKDLHAFKSAPATDLPVLGTTLYAYDIHSRWVSTVAWASDGMRLASSSGDGTVRVWDAATGDNILTYRGHSTPGLLSDLGLQSTVYAVSWSPDGHYIASGGPGTSVHVWDAATGNTILTYRNHSDPSGIFALAWSPDGTRIASSCSGIDKTIQISNATTGESILAYEGHFNRVHVLTRMTIVLTLGALAWSPDSKRMASGGDDKRVHVWDATTGDNIFTYLDHSKQIGSVAWSPDGMYIASAGYDEKTVRIWNAATGHNISIYLGHSSTVRKVAWSPNGKLIASASNDKTVHLWEPAT
ncbi:MAG: TIR domain-containing protein, partial [Chloroflexota bacterium]|nr:TIR domain-containing protein [Chloroflexota bacterium]